MIYLIIVVVILLALSVRVVKEYDRAVIFFLGKFTSVRGPGLILLIPIFEQMKYTIVPTMNAATGAQGTFTCSEAGSMGLGRMPTMKPRAQAIQPAGLKPARGPVHLPPESR